MTAGMSGTICGLYAASERRNAPEQVVFGFSERFAKALRVRGGLTEPQIYGKTYTVVHDPLMWREAADWFLGEARVKVLFHAVVTGVVMDEEQFLGVVVESNAGRSFIRAARIVDASGDAAVIARAGFRYRYGDNGNIQNPTMFFRLGNVDLSRYLEFYGNDTICPPKVTEAIETANASGDYFLPRNRIWIFPTTRPGELMVNATRLSGQDGRMLNVIDPADFTEAELVGRRQVREYARFLKNHVPGCEDAYVVEPALRQASARRVRLPAPRR